MKLDNWIVNNATLQILMSVVVVVESFVDPDFVTAMLGLSPAGNLVLILIMGVSMSCTLIAVKIRGWYQRQLVSLLIGTLKPVVVPARVIQWCQR